MYDVHCKLENFFGKEIVVKNCYTDVQAKYKLGSYCEKKYGCEFDFITFKSVKEEISDYTKAFDDMFGNDETLKNLMDIFNTKKK